MNFSKIWKASAVVFGAFTVPLAAYSLKSREGEVWVWGSGRNGELGLGQQNNISLPQNVKSQRFVEVNAGKDISAGITSEGKLYTWGKNRNGSLGHQPPNMNILLPRIITTVDKVVQVSCGYEHMCAVTQSGQAYIWGLHQEINAFRKRVGNVETVRDFSATNEVKPKKIQLQGVKHVSCSRDYAALVNDKGKVFIMNTGVAGGNQTAITELDINDKIVKVSSGPNFSLALSEAGKVYVWGKNNFGQLGTGSLNTVAKPQLLEALSYEKIVDISCGDNFSGAITDKGEVYTWGFGNQGQLGHGDKSDQLLPRRVQFKQPVKKISCGGAHAALLTAQGRLFMMGRGRQGQLGRFFNDEGNSGYSLQVKPVQQLPSNHQISQVSCGSTHTLILLQTL